MSVRASKFIDLLESQELLSPEIIEELRRQVRESSTRFKPELIAKLLVDNGHLTKFQATKLVSSLSDEEDESETSGKASDTAAAKSDSMNDELTFADSDSEAEESEEEAVAQVFLEDEAPLVQAEEVDVVEAEQSDDADVVQVVEVVEPEPDSPLDSIQEAAPPIPKAVRPTPPKTNPWDSFRILGVGLLLALVLIAGFFLVNYFVRGSAEDRLNQANEAYEQRSYETAASMYQEFAETWPTNENASFARVRSALATIRKDAEGAPDPNLGLKTALETLPTVADEPGLTDQRADLAGVLISLASKFNERAEGRDTQERKELMGQMDQLLALIEDPKFVGQAQRNQQRPTLEKIDEDRNRILREIYRDEELQRAITEMDQSLEQKDTDAAYDIRLQLIRNYPILESNEQLQARVLEASRIQRSLVSSGSLAPQVSDSGPETTAGNSFILGNRYGGQASQLKDQVIFARVKGSVYGLDGASGEILWRHYVGREFESNPIRIGTGSTADALICQPEKGFLQRVEGRTGDSKWFVDFGRPIHTPVVEGPDLFVATRDGEIASLDVEGGQVIWNQKLPQPVEVGPGLAFGKPNLYLPGDHSNVYVLSRSDGTCREVFYSGHSKGSIRVPPQLLLGQLFLFQNINSNSARIRILGLSEDGLELSPSQVPLAVEGNVVVAPQIDGRRLIVQSDLGQLLVLDVEPTSDTQNVSLIASRAKNVLSPQLSWLTAANNKLWVADTRLTRFDLQVSMGRLNNSWSRHDGDEFKSKPMLFDNIIVHSRTLRGNRGVRVAAADADSGDSLWEIDLGVPVTMLVQDAEQNVDAINSAGMLYRLNSQRLRSQADANPGQGKRTMDFSVPVKVNDELSVLMNTSRDNQLALHNNTSNSLEVISANFGGAAPACKPVAVDGKLAVGLDNGQFVLIDPTNGSLASSPYQPPMEPGRKVRWNPPTYMSDSKTLVVGNDLQKLARLSISGSSLRSLTEVDLESPPSGPIIALGDRIAVVTGTLSGDVLSLFDATSLEASSNIALNESVLSGPHPTQFGCLIQTNSQLLAIDEEPNIRWKIAFADSQLVGPPIEQAGQLTVATVSGELWVVDSDSGEVKGRSDAGQPFSAAPIRLPAGLLVGSDEGVVLALPVPTQTDTPSSGDGE